MTKSNARPRWPYNLKSASRLGISGYLAMRKMRKSKSVGGRGVKWKWEWECVIERQTERWWCREGWCSFGCVAPLLCRNKCGCMFVLSMSGHSSEHNINVLLMESESASSLRTFVYIEMHTLSRQDEVYHQQMLLVAFATVGVLTSWGGFGIMRLNVCI